ncbi:putative ATPase [Hydrogenophaga palleronii]|uniref:ATPase n=1 Tax=Hydrogenophaga palleronii TaxID=65655 RepID=A0ABU1WT40_9BURK|nr:AAA family ATPase [Hydrogenophaga palleronii]MDR7152470.1 putative ATPase [Hydrogenophaga palleronii]
MKYRESQKDKKLRLWFSTDMTKALLKSIVFSSGRLRGLNSLKIVFEYPITAIAGKNGAGKSTILALACCAYHGRASYYKLPKRKLPYYTFSDFFIQHSEEIPPQGLVINYTIAYNNWKKSTAFPEGIGIGIQSRKKNAGGKWNDYDLRVNRTVVFLGIERIVPHAERSQSKSYARSFKDIKPKGWEGKVKDIVGYILGKNYDDFRFLEHSKYSLPVVKVGGIVYSGFNMGAGENALFEIFSAIYSAGDGALLVLDEIELGLHAEAQRKLVDKLKEVCLETHTQIICTTHSKEIFDQLPPEARFYVESVAGKTKVTQGISPEFAFTKLSAIHGNELEIFLEDDVAKSILMQTLPSAVRARTKFTVVGSANALARQLAACYVRKDRRSVLAVFDGDQRAKEADIKSHATKMTENPRPDFDQWISDRICYLPGDTWPEAWLLQKASEAIAPLSAVLSADAGELVDILEYGLQAGKHNEFHEMAKHLGLEQDQCLAHFSTVICTHFQDDLTHILASVNLALDR